LGDLAICGQCDAAEDSAFAFDGKWPMALGSRYVCHLVEILGNQAKVIDGKRLVESGEIWLRRRH
jgi:hypothetical protein